jgi:hypothetical protein
MLDSQKVLQAINSVNWTSYKDFKEIDECLFSLSWENNDYLIEEIYEEPEPENWSEVWKIIIRSTGEIIYIGFGYGNDGMKIVEPIQKTYTDFIIKK